MLKMLRTLWWKARAFYWYRSAVADKSGRTQDIGVVAGVQDIHTYLQLQSDGGDLRHAKTTRETWDDLFPGWEKGMLLMVFYPTSRKCLTKEQLETFMLRSGLEAPGEIDAVYSVVKPYHVIGVPSSGMYIVPKRKFKAQWKAKGRRTQ